MKRYELLRLAVGVGVSLILILPPLSIAVAPLPMQQSSPLSGAVGPIPPAQLSLAVAPRLDQAYGKLPLAFEVNRGQTDASVQFLSRGSGYTLFLTSTEAVMVLAKSEARAKRHRFGLPKPGLAQPEKTTRTVVRMKLVGANPKPNMAGLEELPGKVNYFIGNDPKKWRTNVSTYARVEYQNVYPGVNLVYYGNQRQLEYDFVVAPGADPEAIRLAFKGVDKFALNAQGHLILHTAGGEVHQRAPVVYQEINGARREIAGRYVLKGKDRVGFQVAAYDRTKPLVIDPVLVYSTYLGGSGGGIGSNLSHGIAVDASGNAYLTGHTNSTDFPTTAFDTTLGGVAPYFGDAFVAKLNAAGTALVYSTFLGGGGDDHSFGIAVDASGNAYLTGHTTSTDFPTTQGAFQTTSNGGLDAFVTKLNAAGSALVYSTYLGGGGDDEGHGIAVDASDDAYVTGLTTSTDFPTTQGAFNTTSPSGPSNAFVTKLNAAGSALVYSTYLGGSFVDAGTAGTGIAVDASGNAYVTGFTPSADFPTTPRAFQRIFGGSFTDAFVTKLNAAGSKLVYSTFLGGSGEDQGNGIAVDPSGNAYVTGRTLATDFPTTAGAFQTNIGGGAGDAFVTKLDPTGSALVYSTFLGGGSDDDGRGIAVDASGNAYVTGILSSTDFPTTPGAFQTTSNGGIEAFVTKLNAAGSALVYSTYLGGVGGEGGTGIAVDTSGNAYVIGSTNSTDFPTIAGAFQPTFSGGFSDVFVAKISVNTPVGNNVSVSAGNGVTVTLTAVVSPGETGATTSSTGPTPPAGFTLGTPPTFYDVTTTATLLPSVSVCIAYNPMQFADPSSLRLFHFESGAWVDVTTSNDTTNNVICGQVSSLSLFVIAQPSGSPSLGPTNIWVGLANSDDDVGIRFDLRAELYRNGTQLVGSGEVASVPGGSGFNNAQQDTIPLMPVGGVTFQSGDTVSIKLYVRNACSGSGKNSGQARLWYNDRKANSRFDATIGSPRTYFLRDAFALATTPGAGPKKKIDVEAGKKCSPYKTFGTWSTTFP